jgi:adenosine kinase
MGSVCGKKDTKGNGKTEATGQQVVPEGILFSVGSPLLDILVTVSPEFLKKYDLMENQVLLMSVDQLTFYNEIISDIVQNFRSDISYIAGGSAQNTIRVAQWIIDSPHACVFVGSIGKDYFGETLFQKALEDGIVGQYQLVSSVPTGTCLVLVTGKWKRTLLACPAAAELLDEAFLHEPENDAWLEKAKFYYMTAYSLVSSADVAIYLGKYAVQKNCHLILHLSAPYIFTQYLPAFNSVLPYADVLIGNTDEALAFAASQNFKTRDVEEIALEASSLPISNHSFTRIVVITQGTAPVIVAQGKTVKKYKVPSIRPSAVKDFNGAGDAFAGGFLAQFVQGSSVELCVQCGIWAATEVIKCEGCQFPKNKYFKPFLLTGIK